MVMVLDEWLMEPHFRFNFPHKHTSFVLYYPKCNCNCFYCNLDKVFVNCIPFDYDSLELSLPFIDCLVVSGGEPLLAYEDVLEFQRLAKQHNLWFYVYTNGFDKNKITNLLNLYEKTKIVVDVKGKNIKQINDITKTNYGKQIMDTYKSFCSHDRVIFRVNEYTKTILNQLNFKNIEKYVTIK